MAPGGPRDDADARPVDGRAGGERVKVADVTGGEGLLDQALRDVATQVQSKLVRTLRLEGNGLSRGGFGHSASDPWNVRLITSICCSRVSRTKFTAYPETRMVRFGYFSGWSIASRSVSRFKIGRAS